MRFIINVIQIIFFWVWTLISATIGFIILPFLGQKKGLLYSTKIWSYPLMWASNVKIKTEGLENVPMDRPVIYASNHESSFDIPVFFCVFPVPLFFLAKAELKKIPMFGWYVNAVGMVFIERKNHHSAMESLRKAGDEIKKGKNIISFPEGTRTRDGDMLMFKRGTFVLALESGIDVIPVAVSGSRKVNPPGYKITPGTITVRIGKPINVAGFEGQNPDELAKFVENTVRDMRDL